MAGFLTGKSWREFQEKNLHLSPPFDRQQAAHDISTPLCINLKTVQGLTNPLINTKAEYQLSVSLYDVAFRQYCGRQWQGPTMAGRGGASSLPKLQYNQNIYFHTTTTNASLIAVVEVIAHTYDDNGHRKAVSCGWGFIRPFKNNAELPDSARNVQLPTQKVEIYYGSPRALFFMDDPLETNQLLKPISGCQLSFTVCTHKPMLKMMNLIPENVIVSGRDIVPGIVDDQTAGADKLKHPKSLRPIPIQIEGVYVHLQPNIEKFEEELCTLLQEDRAYRENRTLDDAASVSILERRLQVGVHNGWCYVEKPQTFHLEGLKMPGNKPTASPSFRRSSKFTHKRSGSTGSSNSVVNDLVLKNRIQLSEFLEDPLFAVVFSLEYVIGEPLTAKDRKMSLSYARAHTRTVSVRWAAWNPLQHPNMHDVTMSLFGGCRRSPDESFVYKMPSTDMQDESAAQSAGGYLFLQWSSDAKDMLTLPTGSPRGIGHPFASMPSVRSDDSGDLDASGVAWKPPSGRPSISHAPVPGYQYLPRGSTSYHSPPASDPSVSGHHVPLPAEHVKHASATGTHISFQPEPQVFPQQQGYSHAQPPGMGPVYPHMSVGPTGMYPMMPPSSVYPMNIMQMTDPGSARLTVPDLHELPFTPVHAPILAQGPQPRGGMGLSRAAYARLYSAGFPPVVDRNGEPPDVLDPSSPVTVNLNKEMADPLQCNEIVFQFLAFSKLMMYNPSESTKSAGTVFFTFQFYRFPQVTSERLLLAKPQNDLTSDPHSMPFILQRLEKDGSVMEGQPPGFEVKYYLDPSFLKPGENSLFYQHLARQTLHIDVWDGDSLLLIGSSAVDLKYLCRNGSEAVQTTFELDVITSEYHDEVAAGENRPADPRTASVKPLMKGKLHLRIANIGQEGEVKRIGHKTEIVPLPNKTHVIISQTAGNSSYKGGSLMRTGNGLKKQGISRAHPLTDNREVATLMFSKDRAEEKEEAQKGSHSERQRKLARMNAVRQEHGEHENEKTTTIMGYRKEKSERTRDLKTMEIYRMQTKREGILNMLSNTITTEHTIYPAFGTAEFFEFVLKNPFNEQQNITVDCTDPSVSVITDAREWRHFKQINNINTHVEEGMFTKNRKSENPEIFLRPKETVNIPIKYQSFQADQSVQPQGPVDPFRKKETIHKQTQEECNILHTRSVRVIFKSEEGKPISVLQLRIEPQPHVVDQTFRFYHPEQSFLKKSVRLQEFHALPANQIGGSGVSKVYVRSSDPNIICDSRTKQPGEPHDVFVKCALGASPQVKRFHVAVYIDPYLSRPTQIWQFYIHSLQRVDVTCIDGQTSRFALILRGTQSSRLARCFSSHPNEMQLSPEDQFLLQAGAVHELNVAIRPMKTGNKFYYLNVVDIEYHQLIRTWLVCVNCRAPLISRSFELTLPVGGGKQCSKRITYTNPYPGKKVFIVTCDRNDLLQFKETRLEIDGGEPYTIGMRFNPVSQPGVAEIMVFINDEEDKNEETFRITANYKFPGL